MLAIHAPRWPRNRPAGLARVLPTVLPLAALSVLIIHYLFAAAYGAQLGERSLSLSSNEVSAHTLYQLNISLVTAGTIGSIEIQFCSNDPFPEDPCSVPAGLDTSTANFVTQSGVTGFVVSPASNANTIILSRVPAAAATGRATYGFDEVKNPSSPGSYYARVQTFASADASGPASDYGGIVFAIANQITITAEVPPYLLFCTAITISGLNCANGVGDYIDFGEFSSGKASSATSQLLVATNAEQGYAISIAGTTLASGNNVIAALSVGDVSRPGTGQFGFNLKTNTTPIGGNEVSGPGVSQPQATYAQPNTYRFTPGDTIISTAVPDNLRLYTSSYMVNVPKTQSPGIYVSTVTYVCLANF